jgi:hypothetical protein
VKASRAEEGAHPLLFPPSQGMRKFNEIFNGVKYLIM